MKKLFALILAVIMISGLAACGKKPAGEDAQASGDQQTQVGSGSELTVDGDPAEYTQSYWEEKYPEYMFCTFYIEENGVEKSYFWPMGYEDLDGTMEKWIECPLNWNGWHKTDDGCIVNRDETLKLTDEWVNEEGLSSFCTVATEPYGG